MKKFLTAGAALVGFGLSNLALASDGTITFTGEVSSKTCTIDSKTANQVVPLSPVSQSSLAPGQNAGFKQFHIEASQCTQGAKVKAKFEVNENVNTTLGALKNELTGAEASNVYIQLFDSNQKAINLVDGTNTSEVVVGADGAAKLSFYAAYLAPTGEAVKAGKVATKVTYSMTYE